MSGQQYEQKGAQIPGALGREIASNEERGEQSFEGVNRPSAAKRAEGAEEDVYPSAADAPGSKDDLGVVRTQPEEGMEGSGEAAVRVGPTSDVPPTGR